MMPTAAELRAGGYPGYGSGQVPSSAASMGPSQELRPQSLPAERISYKDLPKPSGSAFLAEIAPLLAEFVGAFLYAFTVISVTIVEASVWNPAVCGLFYCALVYGFWKISGGHICPAVTLACAICGAISWSGCLIYIVVQVLGAICGGSVSHAVLGQQEFIILGYGYTMIAACLLEMVYTMVLCLVFLSVTFMEKGNELKHQFYALAIGFVVIAGGYAAGPVTGGIFNPIISLSFAFFAGFVGPAAEVKLRLFYALFQMIGAILAAALFFFCFRPRRVPAPVPAPVPVAIAVPTPVMAPAPAPPPTPSPVQIVQEVQWSGTGTLVLRVLDVAVPGLTTRPTIITRHGNHQYLSTHLEDSTYSSWGGLNDFVIPVVEGFNSLSIDVVDAFDTNKEHSVGIVIFDLKQLTPGQVFKKRDGLSTGKGEIEFELRFDGSVTTTPKVTQTNTSLQYASQVHSNQAFQTNQVQTSQVFRVQNDMLPQSGTLTPGAAGRIFDSLDKNHDGVLSREEFEAARAQIALIQSSTVQSQTFQSQTFQSQTITTQNVGAQSQMSQSQMSYTGPVYQNQSDFYEGQIYRQGPLDAKPLPLLARLLAEFIGTFVLTGTIGLCLLAHCFALPLAAAAAYMCMYYCFVDVSGSHFNPAVTIALQTGYRGKMSLLHAGYYCLAQVLGGVLAGLLCPFYTGNVLDAGSNILQLGPSASSWWIPLPIEVLLAALLCYTFLVVSKRSFPFTLSIGVVQLVGIFSASKISGGIMNPALTVCLVIMRTRLNYGFAWWHLFFYLFTQFAGACLAPSVYLVTHRSEKLN